MGTDEETATQGLDGLAERCQKYYAKGCRVAKWRAVLRIGPNCPSELAMIENAHTLARYASICQMNGLVPIVEPDILPDGKHSIEECAAKSRQIWTHVSKALIQHHIILEGCLIKTGVVIPGMQSGTKENPKAIAYQTLTALNDTIPANIPGIMFLSGGQSEEDASLNLNAINAIKGFRRPWALSFCFGRAL